MKMAQVVKIPIYGEKYSGFPYGENLWGKFMGKIYEENLW